MISPLVVRQELHLIVEVVEQHAWAEFVAGDGLEGDLVVLIAFFECNDLLGEVHRHLDDVALCELERLYAIVVLCLRVAPTASVRAHHVRSVPNRTKIKSVILACYHFRVAHSHGHPV